PMMENNPMSNMMPQQYPYYQQQNPYYNMPYPQGAPIASQYASMPNIMPMENNMPPMMPEEEDCGCGGEERTLYSPQPGGPQYARPLYYQPTQAAYAPQPGTMYYQPDPPDIFGNPLVEEEE
ncbi:peptigoglycan-binding protein LysM, partial [Bacillus sp. JJ1127]